MQDRQRGKRKAGDGLHCVGNGLSEADAEAGSRRDAEDSADKKYLSQPSVSSRFSRRCIEFIEQDLPWERFVEKVTQWWIGGVIFCLILAAFPFNLCGE